MKSWNDPILGTGAGAGAGMGAETGAVASDALFQSESNSEPLVSCNTLLIRDAEEEQFLLPGVTDCCDEVEAL